MSYLLTITHPTGAPSIGVTPRSVSMAGEIDEPAAITFDLPENFAIFDGETDDNNPVQVNSLITLTRTIGSTTTTLFTGFIETINRSQDKGLCNVRVQGLDKMAKLEWTLVHNGSAYVGKLWQTATVYIGGGSASYIELVPLDSTTQTHGYSQANLAFYPATDSLHGWRAMTGSPRTPNTTLGDDLADDDTSATCTTADEGLQPYGVAHLTDGVNEEFAAFDGYDVNASSVFILKNLIRGCLGSSATAFSTSDTVDLALPKRISDTVMPVIYGWRADQGPANSDEPIDPSYYTIQWSEGYFEFTVDPYTQITMTFNGNVLAPDKIKAVYKVVDEDSATARVMAGDDSNGVIENILLASKAMGGPGYTSSDWDIDVRRVVLPYFIETSGANTRNTIATLLEDHGPLMLGTIAGTTYHAVGWWYDSQAGKLVIRGIEQSATPTYLLGVESWSADSTLSDVYSGVLVVGYGDYNRTGTEQAYATFVRLVSSYGVTDKSYQILDTDAYAKLIDNAFGNHRVFVMNVGQEHLGNYGAIGANKLRELLKIGSTRRYEVRGRDMTIPTLGTTVRMPDGYTGVVISFALELQGGAEKLSLRVCDFTAGFE